VFSVIESNLDSICVTPRLHRQEMFIYVPRPELCKLGYMPHDGTVVLSSSLRLLQQVHQQVLIEQGFSRLNIASAANGGHTQTASPKHKVEWVVQLTKFYHKARHIYEELGAWAADYFIFQTVELLRSKSELTKQLCFGSREGVKLSLLRVLDRALFTHQPADLSLESHLSSKVESLIAFLESQEPKDCFGLVFVQQRATVGVLVAILRAHPRTLGRFECGTFVGLSNSSKKRYNVSELLDLKTQENTMAEFREGKKNLIISTEVLEEGIDVAACNLVICFDPPSNLKAFIQRRGRARKGSSKFAIMSPEGGIEPKIDTWRELENALNKLYQDEDRVSDEAVSLEEKEEVMNYRLHVKSTG
jgi:ERCC4-related helicase